MTAKHTYECNLCRRSITQTGSGDAGGVGLTWQYAGIHFGMVNDAEQHICSRCLNSIESELKRLDEVPPLDIQDDEPL